MKFKNSVPTQWESFNNSIQLAPNYSFSTANDDFDNLFNFFDTNFSKNNLCNFGPTIDQNYFPRVDINETKNEFLISAELPGVNEKDIQVTIENKTLTLKGDKKAEKDYNQVELFNSERCYGSFQRSFKIPELIDQNKIDASTDNGILMVKLPKKAGTEKKVKKVPINQ